MAKLTKAQQALLNRLQAGAIISKGWMQTSFRDSARYPVSNATVRKLIQLGKLTIVRKGDWETLVTTE